jgi:membrane protease YdiL (CAAX protease family)
MEPEDSSSYQAVPASEPPPPPAVPAPRRPLGHPLLRSALYLVLAFVVIQGVCGRTLELLAKVLGRQDLWQGVLAGSGASLLAYYFVYAVLLVLMTIPFVRLLNRNNLASIGVRWPWGGPRAASSQAIRMCLGVLALLGSWMVVAATVSEIRLRGLSDVFQKGPTWWPGPGGGGAVLVLLALGFLIQGGTEEWIVRGYIFHSLRERWRWWGAALGSSLLFSLLHARNPGISWVALANIVVAGFILAELVERTGSLWAATIAHGAWNFIMACLLSLPVSGFRIFHLLDLSIEGPPLVTGGLFGPEGSLVVTALGLILAVILRPRGPREAAREAGGPGEKGEMTAPGESAA